MKLYETEQQTKKSSTFTEELKRRTRKIREIAEKSDNAIIVASYGTLAFGINIGIFITLFL